MQHYTVRVGTEERRSGMPRVAITKIVTWNTVDLLSDDELVNAVFYASIGRTDDRLLALLRREHVRRLVEGGDIEGLQKAVDQAVFDAVGALFNHSYLEGDAHFVAGYNDDGKGVSVSTTVELYQE